MTNKKKYKRVCIACTTYSVMLYLLLCKDYTDVENTCFLLDNEALPDELYSKLPNEQMFRYVDDSITDRKELLKIRREIKEEFSEAFSKADFFILDHMPGVSMYVGLHKYTLLEDAPGIYTRMENNTYEVLADRSEKTLKWFWEAYRYHGPIWHRPVGMNPYCKNRILTDKEDLKSSFVKGKTHTLVDLKELWDKKPQDYKNWILSIFGITQEDISYWNTFDSILLTQPWMHDFNLSKEEFIACYKPSIEKFRNGGILIKPHPRDTFKWKEEFPDVAIMDTKFPMQFLCYMGVIPKYAITMSSSAISAFSEQTQKIIIGHSVCPKLLNILG